MRRLSLLGADRARARPAWREALGVPVEQLAVMSRFFISPALAGAGSAPRW